MALTALTIKNLKNQNGKPYSDYLDANGLKVRVTVSGTKTYIYRYKMDGKPYEYTIGKCDYMPLTEARRIHAALREQVKTGINPKIERDLNLKALQQVPTLREFSRIYIERYAKQHKKSWQSDQRYLDADVLPILGNLPIDKITRPQLIKLLDKKQDTGAMVARNRLISLLSKLFNFAIERGYINASPITGIKRTAEKSRTRTLTEGELIDFWEWTGENSSLSPINRLALRLVLVTGQRAGEVCQMTREQINGDLWTIPDTNTKNGLSHTVPLTALALSIIDAALRFSGDKLIFPNTKGALLDEGVLSKAMQRMTWQDNRATPHDLRRTAITGISNLGFNRLVQDKVANHKDRSVGGIYDRNSYDKEKRLALEAWSRKLNEILNNESSNVVQFRSA